MGYYYPDTNVPIIPEDSANVRNKKIGMPVIYITVIRTTDSPSALTASRGR